MVRKFTQDEVSIRELNLDLKRIIGLLDKHITQCEREHESYNERISTLEKTSSYFNIWDKLKTVGLVCSAGIIGWLLKTVLMK